MKEFLNKRLTTKLNKIVKKIILISGYKTISGKKNAKVGFRVYVSVRAYVGVCVCVYTLAQTCTKFF